MLLSLLGVNWTKSLLALANRYVAWFTSFWVDKSLYFGNVGANVKYHMARLQPNWARYYIKIISTNIWSGQILNKIFILFYLYKILSQLHIFYKICY
jgi:hypothetical protein